VFPSPSRFSKHFSSIFQIYAKNVCLFKKQNTGKVKNSRIRRRGTYELKIKKISTMATLRFFLIFIIYSNLSEKKLIFNPWGNMMTLK